MKTLIAVGVILLFLGVAVAPGVHGDVAKEAGRRTLLGDLAASLRLGRRQPGASQEAKDVQGLRASSVRSSPVNARFMPVIAALRAGTTDGPGLYLLFFILEILTAIVDLIHYVGALIKAGELVKTIAEYLLVFFVLIPVNFLLVIVFSIIIWISGILHPNTAAECGRVLFSALRRARGQYSIEPFSP